MAANNILRVGESATVILTDAAYLAHAQRTAGYSAGTALQELFNKVAKQSGLMSSGLAQFIADFQAEDIDDTLTPAEVASYLRTAILSQIDSVNSATTDLEGIVELATSAEAQALTNALLALTPSTLNAAFMGTNQLLATNGYQKYPGGKIEQWGKALLPSGTGDNYQSITFPIPFPTECFQVQPTVEGNIQRFDDTVSSASLTTTGCRIYSIRTTSGLSVAWKAIGH